MPREKVARRGVIRMEILMYSIVGVPVMGALAAQDDYPQ
jgi:hypothetical protein